MHLCLGPFLDIKRGIQVLKVISMYLRVNITWVLCNTRCQQNGDSIGCWHDDEDAHVVYVHMCVVLE